MTKPFGIWLVITLLLFGGLSGASHVYLNAHPRRVLIAVDSAFPMQAVWSRVPARIDELTGRRYTRYALITEKNRIHGWADQPDFRPFSPYAPRDFSALSDTDRFPEIAEANTRILITNAPPAETDGLRGWDILRLSP